MSQWKLKRVLAISALIVVVESGYRFLTPGQDVGLTIAANAAAEERAAIPKGEANTVDLEVSQLNAVKVAAVQTRDFPQEKEAIGSIDFNEELSVQVFSPYSGRIVNLYGKLGDNVRKGQTLFTIDSPDLLQSESNLISAAGVLDLTNRNLNRLKELFKSHAIAQRDLEQATSDQQAAEGVLRAARDTVRLFGKSEADIDRIISQRAADPILVVPSPIDGQITARNAAPGLFVQPGSVPAPYSVANIDTMWMLANVSEADSPAFHVGQAVTVTIAAFPNRTFEGKITAITPVVDPNTRRVLVRSDIRNPTHELLSGMFADFNIQIGDPIHSLAVPLGGVVREGDGTTSVWVTSDRRRFTKRTVEIGLEHKGYWQILSGVEAGELIATEGAIFLSNMLIAGHAD
ncbi:efflux RND transporter periplasmic adaptor subunit [Hyphomicrobium sp.]|uniref:efflux RND transporter periplasmic adaptor subunit n=1 Tax=Hyphomicrobium sp. TaxID=82 RepID=UPI000F9CD46D|nr:efflux RND transporter periplasmic adaptor subunit [Hyphomicrobium sp.]RUP08638.1 MAG: efflux RND transporter periplasmic adaptor subunit [Hyphomicrobium sp.]